jgi:hypothetical protein
MKTLATIFAALLALALQGGFAGAQANSTSGHCTGMTVTDFVSSDVINQTTSSAWQNVTDAHLNFTTSSTGCVVITFEGVASVSGNGGSGWLRVRTLMDGNNLCVPATTDPSVLIAADPAPAIASSIIRVCKNVTAGAHTVQVQYNSGSGIAEIDGHVLTVTHN